MRWKVVIGLLIFIMGSGCDPYQEGMGMLDRGEYEQALEFFVRQVNENPEDPRAHNQLGYAYSRLKMYDKAVEEYAKAIQLKPDYFDARLNLGAAHLLNRELWKAERHLQKALHLDPDSEAAHVNLAWTYHHFSKFDLAWKHINRAIELSGGKNNYTEVVNRIKKKEKIYGKPAQKKKAEQVESKQPGENNPK